MGIARSGSCSGVVAVMGSTYSVLADEMATDDGGRAQTVFCWLRKRCTNSARDSSRAKSPLAVESPLELATGRHGCCVADAEVSEGMQIA